MLDYSFYGDIYAKTDVYIYYLKHKVFETIPLDEIDAIWARLLNSHEGIEYTLSTRYHIDFEELKTF